MRFSFLFTQPALAHQEALVQTHLMHQLMQARAAETGSSEHAEALSEIRAHLVALQPVN
jgi:hypothetical protein